MSVDNPFPKSPANGTLNRTVASAGDTLHHQVDSVSSSAHQAVDRVAAAATRAADSIDGQARRVKQLPYDGLAYCKDRIREQPAEAVAATFLVGFMLGWLVARR